MVDYGMVVKLELCIFAGLKIGIRPTVNHDHRMAVRQAICLFIALLMTITVVVVIIRGSSC